MDMIWLASYRMLAKAECGPQCPAVYDSSDDDPIVVGKTMLSSEELKVDGDETAVSIPRELHERSVKAIKETR